MRCDVVVSGVIGKWLSVLRSGCGECDGPSSGWKRREDTYLTDAGSSQSSLPPLLLVLVLVTALGSSAMQLRRLERVVSREAKDGAVYSGRLMASIAVETASPAVSCSECVLLAK